MSVRPDRATGPELRAAPLLAALYGLQFYLGAPVELVTSRAHGSPLYWTLEPWATEVAELGTTPRRHLFLIRARTRDAFTEALATSRAGCREVGAEDAT